MSDTRGILERGVGGYEPDTDALEHVLRRRDRRERRRKVEAGALGLLVCALLVAAVVKVLDGGPREMPASGPITPSNVSGLRLAWSGQVGGPIDAPMSVQGDRLYVVSQGRLSAFSTTCRSERCDAIWSARLPDADVPTTGVNLWWGGPTVVGSTVYVGAGEGRALGFPTSCTGTCEPTWQAETGGVSVASPPVAGNGGTIYLGVDLALHGRLEAFPAVCDVDPCRPRWFADLPGGFVGSTPVVAGGVVFVGSEDGTLQGFDARACAAAGGRCEPRPGMSLSLHVSPPVSPVGAMMSPLAVEHGMVFAAAGSRLSAVSLGCDKLPVICEAWTARTDSYVDWLTVADGRVYASTFDDGALRVSSTSGGGAWSIRGTSLGSRTLVSDGVLFVGAQQAGVTAYAADCGDDGGTCAPLWSGPTDGSVSVGITRSGGALYVGDASGHVYGFTLDAPARAVATPPRSPAAPSWLPAVLLAVSVLVFVVGFRSIRGRYAW